MIMAISELLGNSIPPKIDSLEINSTTGPFENNTNQFIGHLGNIFNEDDLLEGYNLKRTKCVRLFELATSMDELHLAWSMWRVNRINRSEPQINISDAVIGYAFKAFLYANKSVECNVVSEQESNVNKLLARIESECNLNCSSSISTDGRLDRAIEYIMNYIADRDLYGLTPSEWMLQWLLSNSFRLDLGLGIYRALDDFGYLEYGTPQCSKNALVSLLKICASCLPGNAEIYEMILNECMKEKIEIPSFHWIRCAALSSGKDTANTERLLKKVALSNFTDNNSAVNNGRTLTLNTNVVDIEKIRNIFTTFATL